MKLLKFKYSNTGSGSFFFCHLSSLGLALIFGYWLLLFVVVQAVIKGKYGIDACNVGDEGGFAPSIARQGFGSSLSLYSFILMYRTIPLIPCMKI